MGEKSVPFVTSQSACFQNGVFWPSGESKRSDGQAGQGLVSVLWLALKTLSCFDPAPSMARAPCSEWQLHRSYCMAMEGTVVKQHSSFCFELRRWSPLRLHFQHGKDFEAIQNNIAMRYKKRGKPANMVKNKEQVRHFYYRTWHKISKHIDFANGEFSLFCFPTTQTTDLMLAQSNLSCRLKLLSIKRNWTAVIWTSSSRKRGVSFNCAIVKRRQLCCHQNRP